MVKLKVVLASVCMLAGGCLGPAVAWADIVGSEHDFSSVGWSGNEICKPCHTPHNADTSVNAPLWNHEMTAATFVLYGESTVPDGVIPFAPWVSYTEPTYLQPGSESLLCLSCHDGTVAMDSFGGTTGTVFMQGDAMIGTNLSDDHPVGVQWEHSTLGDPSDPGSYGMCSNCHSGGTGPTNDGITPFYDGRIECLTCHEPHNQGQGGMQRITMDGSQLCLNCHAI